MTKKRLDTHLAEIGEFESRRAAQAAVMGGLVVVDGRTDVKPGKQITGDEDIEIRNSARRYVSRGGLKLEAALDVFDVNVEGRIVLDVGASTGGFTHCLLERGAAFVMALDVGKGQLHESLGRNPRVVVMDKHNARYLKSRDLPKKPSLSTVDVAFISLKKVLEPVFGVLELGGEVIALVKPQFEAGPRMVGKGGVIRDPEVHVRVLSSLKEWFVSKGMGVRGVMASPIKGPKGNMEFFVLLDRNGEILVDNRDINAVVEEAHAGKHD